MHKNVPDISLDWDHVTALDTWLAFSNKLPVDPTLWIIHDKLSIYLSPNNLLTIH